MSASKRPCPTDENDDNLNPFVKKQKKGEDKITSSLFKGKGDQDQFRVLFDCIDSSQLCQQLGIFQDLTKYIAEYATGQIKHCAGDNCSQEILILEENKLDETHVLINGDDHYCSLCLNDYAPCACEGDDVYTLGRPYHMMHLPTAVECKGCGILWNSICEGREGQCVMLACDCVICDDCEHSFYIGRCGECDESVCYDEEDCSIKACQECDGECDWDCYNENYICKNCYYRKNRL